MFNLTLNRLINNHWDKYRIFTFEYFVFLMYDRLDICTFLYKVAKKIQHLANKILFKNGHFKRNLMEMYYIFVN